MASESHYCCVHEGLQTPSTTEPRSPLFTLDFAWVYVEGGGISFLTQRGRRREKEVKLRWKIGSSGAAHGILGVFVSWKATKNTKGTKKDCGEENRAHRFTPEKRPSRSAPRTLLASQDAWFSSKAPDCPARQMSCFPNLLSTTSTPSLDSIVLTNSPTFPPTASTSSSGLYGALESCHI